MTLFALNSIDNPTNTLNGLVINKHCLMFQIESLT